MAIYYIDGTTLSNSTAVYTDPTLSNYAPAAFYSDGVVSREQVPFGNVFELLPPQLCPTCATPCGTSIAASGGEGIYRLDVDTGGTSTDTGAIVITFDPVNVPDGIRVIYDGTSYNKLSSPNFGLLQSGTAAVPTFIGSTGSQSGCGGAIEGTYNLDVYEYSNNSFVNTGNNETVIINAPQNQLTSSAPGDCVMVIPKPNPSPTVVNVEVIGPCGGTAWNIDVKCPVEIPRLLAGYNSSKELVCAEILDEYVYHVPVSGTTQNNVNIHDYIFADKNGAVSVNDGWYLHPTGYVYKVESGVVTQKETSLCGRITLTDCTTGQNWTMNDRFNSNVLNEVIQYKRINAVTQEVEQTVYCGTITSFTGTTTNAQQVSPISRACDDTVHCP